MNRRRSWLLLTLALLALFFVLLRPAYVVGRTPLPPDREAMRNDFLLLGELLEQFGARTQSLRHLPTELPAATGSTLWLAVPTRMLSHDAVAALLAWVRAGGRLVLAPDTPALWEKDPLLTAAGLRLVQQDNDDMNDVLGPPAERPSATAQGFLYALDDTHALRAAFSLRRAVATLDAADEAADADYGAGAALLCDPLGCHAWQVPLGDGEILALSEAGPFTNDQLPRFDHAALLRWLLTPQTGDNYWIVYQEEVPSLFVLLWQHAAFALLALAAAILLWMLAAGRRFGPLLAGTQPARRRLAEHVEASALLLARHGQRNRLWQAAYDDFRRTLRRRHPQAQELDAEDTAALVAQQTGVDIRQARRALAPTLDDLAHDDTVAAAIRRLDTLRRLL